MALYKLNILLSIKKRILIRYYGLTKNDICYTMLKAIRFYLNGTQGSVF